MIKASKKDKDLVVNLLSHSFKDNQSVAYIVGKRNDKQKRIRALIDYSFELCFLFGEVWLSDDKKACALVLYPHQKRTTLKSTWLDIQLIIRAIGWKGALKAIKRESKIKGIQSKEEMAYLWFIGVLSTEQHKGIGSSLLKQVLDGAANAGLSVYLETSTPKNIPWYRSFGFQNYGTINLGYDLYFMKWEPIDKTELTEAVQHN
ncbi:MAG TPA: GNAT family N-acetyltransferase [Pseudosphingobacterium sp.]|nr:GNAT family N-acetyltransferase [Pseudosphingobacterium sp.]